jgi:hypothetical protein
MILAMLDVVHYFIDDQVFGGNDCWDYFVFHYLYEYFQCVELFKRMWKCHFELIICLFYLFFDEAEYFSEEAYSEIW